jgi:hypothetical protein
MSPNKYKIKYKHIRKKTGEGSVASNIIKIILLLPLLPLVLYVLLLSHISKYYIVYLPLILILKIYTYNYSLNISPNVLRMLTNIFLGLHLYSAVALLYGLLLFFLFPNIYIIN